MVSAGEPEPQPLVNIEQNPPTEHQQESETAPEGNEPPIQAIEQTGMQVTPESDVGEDVSMQELPPAAQPVAEEMSIQPAAEENTAQEGSTSAAPTDSNAPAGSEELPEGMDPEFLAALPEDIRQEVIRDHLRQQRAQRLNQQAAASSSSGASEGQQEGVNAAAEEEEVLDQEFLAALPPELQEEVLAQHEQRIAQRNRAAQANANADALAAAGADVEGVFESLPPTLRQQVLADIDETMLQVLPPNLLEEANRARANFEQQQAFRFSRILDHRSGHRGMDGGARAGQPLGPGASTVTTEEHGVQIFDRESVVTMLMLYFLDHEKFSLQRLQKLLKPLCLHSGTCDYIIWCLLSILDSLNNDMGEDETTVSNEGWIDGFQIQSALNQPEKALRLTPDSVKVHPLIKSNVCLRILETLVFLARNFPQHFLPNKIRSQSSSKRFDSIPDIRAFWDIVRSINKKTNAEENKPSSRALTQLRDIIPPLLEQSPVAFLLQYTNSALVKSNAPLMDKSMKILQTVAQSIPSNCESINESSISWLNTWLQEFSKLILDTCLEEGLKDGRMFLNEILRIMPNQRPTLFKMLYDNVKEQGLHLQEDIKTLLDELAQLKIKKLALASDINSTEPQIIQKPTTSTEALATSVGESAVKDGDALPLSTLKAFTSRNSQSRKFLKSLETISFLRNQLKLAERRRQAARTQQQPSTSQAIPAAQPSQPAGEETTAATETSPKEISNVKEEEKNLQDMLDCLEPLWKLLSTCLDEMSQLLDSHAVLSLQHAAEAFFLAHAFSITTNKDKAEAPVPTGGEAEQQQVLPSSSSVVSGLAGVGSHLDMNKYSKNMFAFAEKHRTVLNQILRSNTNNLMEESAFAILTHFPKLLDFDVKRKYFYKEIRKLDDRSRHEDVAVRIRRAHLFSDSFRELYRLRNSDWKARFYIIFEGEEGQDAGGLLREWYSIITREVFNPNYALFITAPGDRVTYMINKSSNINPEHLDYFKFVGRVIAKAIYDNKQLDCYFTRAFYKHILNVSVKYQDIESEDPSYFKSLEFLLNNPIEDLGADLTFSVEVEEFGVRSMRQLKEDGAKVPVTDTNKEEYVQLVCQMKMTGSIRKQLDAFLEGFYQIIPRQLISIFDEQELELLISGLPEIDIDDLCNNTEYKTYTRSSPQIQWYYSIFLLF
ncbi:HECT-domain (ubiquitin-transferase) domain-containing protein [Ditylenchus destructor]|uniref:HECT-type E3 ubiquitin transferase n=1 Tax=Ditylenchus destructor TaxID=166010 RepID=A0AAD4N6Q8_9BILA|nr:HECT-domain (ubiquitin-transferase) domain-containing protein [Ditylenchus destructor]